MKSVCAWCKTRLDAGEAVADSCPITHGICLPCAQQFLSDLSEPLRDFLDRLGVPVLVVDHSPLVRTANAQARDLLGKDLVDVEDQLPGQVIECIHAAKPGGCGHQLHCQSCTLRRVVLETHSTGKSYSRIPAYPDLQIREGAKLSHVEISTELVGKIVLLRLHEVPESDRVENLAEAESAN